MYLLLASMPSRNENKAASEDSVWVPMLQPHMQSSHPWNAFVNEQLYIPGDPQTVRLGNATTTNAENQVDHKSTKNSRVCIL